MLTLHSLQQRNMPPKDIPISIHQELILIHTETPMAMAAKVIIPCSRFGSSRRPHPTPPPLLSNRRSLGGMALQSTAPAPKSVGFQRGIKAAAAPPDASLSSQAQQTQVPLLLRKIMSSIVTPYLERNLTAVSALELLRASAGGVVAYDHFAFRTFGVDGCGIDSIAQLFLDLGYQRRDQLLFPAKKLQAFWFSPPQDSIELEGDGVDGPLPRIFISELLVDQLSPKSQSIIRKYTSHAAPVAKHAALSSVLNCLPWPTPSFADYQQLAKESEYAAWTLVNGYALNHLTVSVHRLKSKLQEINQLNEFLQQSGIKLNSDGGVLKTSPDGDLLQSSSVADSVSYTFADGEIEAVPASYIEFAQRLILPQYANLADQVKEWHRRDGFEVGNADKIFESTSSNQTGARART